MPGENDDRWSVSLSNDNSLHGRVSFVDIDADSAGQRIDNFLLGRLKGVPKSRIYRLLRKGEVRVNKGRIKPEYRLLAGDQIRLPPIRVAERGQPPLPGEALRANLQSSIVFENEQFLVLNKPSGLAVHGGSGVNLGVVEALRGLRPEQKHLELVHRLDRDTSGCLLIAKTRSALRDLQAQMREGALSKRYQVLVVGAWPLDLKRVNAPLKKNTLRSGERIVRPDQEGKPAVTHFKVIRACGDFTLLEATLETGRTHQIRVHCQMMGHAVAGDPKYGDRESERLAKTQGLKRLFLHAHELGLRNPADGDWLVCRAPLPWQLETFVDGLA